MRFNSILVFRHSSKNYRAFVGTGSLVAGDDGFVSDAGIMLADRRVFSHDSLARFAAC